MFGLGLATKIYVAIEAVDMRKGFEGLYGLVRDQLGQDPLSGYLFLFSNRTRTRLKAAHGEFQKWAKIKGLPGLDIIAAMRDFIVLLVHLVTTLIRLAKPGGFPSVVAESVLLRHQ